MKKLNGMIFLIFTFAFVLAACNGGENVANDSAASDNSMANNHAGENSSSDMNNDAAVGSSDNAGEPAEGAVPEIDESAAEGAFQISAAESAVRFKIWEVLMGADTLVIGTTSQVEGWIAVDFADPGAASTSVFEVDLTGIATDSNNRNGQVHKRILETGAFPTASFEAVEFVGLPDSAAVGDTVEFQIIGNLTIKDVTKSVTFDVKVTIISEARIEGLATLEVAHADFGVDILRLPSQVASVEDITVLEIEFIAEK